MDSIIFQYLQITSNIFYFEKIYRKGIWKSFQKCIATQQWNSKHFMQLRHIFTIVNQKPTFDSESAGSIHSLYKGNQLNQLTGWVYCSRVQDQHSQRWDGFIWKAYNLNFGTLIYIICFNLLILISSRDFTKI